ncbi:hypothetical protein LTR36_006003 [Oleoguttula mirabilis]|uniref:Uncharacterized protein n=1 Tax=Oleoguttula mirabilis TaxID=1507867 RepID=A0AAV9JDX4_9PEZI|nr:hypothetical protein LTR36_006003 [Oleoguttula mirabilis]
MDSISTSTVDYNTRREVFVVMHHDETELAPEPVSEDGINVSRPLYVHRMKVTADRHARWFAEHRRLILGLPPAAVAEPQEWRDSANALIGWGWMITARYASSEPDVLGRIFQRELVWVERRWMEV